MNANPAHMFFCGSVPLEHEVDVFNALAEIGGERLRRVPDGEFGDRRMWVIGQYAVLAASPALEFGPFPADGLTRRTCYQIPRRLRAGSGERHRLQQYWLRPARVKFIWAVSRDEKGQAKSRRTGGFRSICRPRATHHADDRGIRPKAAAEKACRKALLAELEEIQRRIPHSELAITWDVVHAVLTSRFPSNKYITQFFTDPKDDFLHTLVELGDAVAGDVELGYHLCYGSQDHKHALEPRDLTACVTISNAVAAQLGRRLDYVHMPVPRESTATTTISSRWRNSTASASAKSISGWSTIPTA